MRLKSGYHGHSSCSRADEWIEFGMSSFERIVSYCTIDLAYNISSCPPFLSSIAETKSIGLGRAVGLLSGLRNTEWAPMQCQLSFFTALSTARKKLTNRPPKAPLQRYACLQSRALLPFTCTFSLGTGWLGFQVSATMGQHNYCISRAKFGWASKTVLGRCRYCRRTLGYGRWQGWVLGAEETIKMEELVQWKLRRSRIV